MPVSAHVNICLTQCVFKYCLMFLLRSEWKYFYLVDSMLNSIWKDINGYVKTAIESGNLFFFWS